MSKLLQINTVIHLGSTGRIVEEIDQLAISNGWESYIAYGRNKRKSKSRSIQIGTKWGILFHWLRTRLFDRHGLGSIRATKRLVEQIEKINPDVIHLHNLHGYYINFKVLFKFLKHNDKPVIWTFHDCWPLTGHCVYFSIVGCEKWKTKCFQCPQKHKYPTSFLLDRSNHNYQLKKKLFTSLTKLTIVPVSRWLEHNINQSYFSRHSIQVINNGIDTSLFHPVSADYLLEKHKLKGKCIILGVAYDWDDRKGLPDFIELSKHLDNNSHIVMVGLKKSQIKNLPRNILGVMRTENVYELVAYYNMADIYFNSSREETFGLTVIESMACGLPSIVYNSTASPELVTKETGIIVEEGDIQAVLDSIILIKSRGKSFYSTACVERAKKLYDKNDRFMDYIKLYESVINKE